MLMVLLLTIYYAGLFFTQDIKALIYQKCEVCDIEFRIWKVYLYHLAALEHAKVIDFN